MRVILGTAVAAAVLAAGVGAGYLAGKDSVDVDHARSVARQAGITTGMIRERNNIEADQQADRQARALGGGDLGGELGDDLGP